MYIVHLDTSGTIHDCKWIAATYNFDKKRGQLWERLIINYLFKSNLFCFHLL